MTYDPAVIDEHILHNRVLPAFVALREEFGYSISPSPSTLSASDMSNSGRRGQRS
jgi:hypothetical protein